MIIITIINNITIILIIMIIYKYKHINNNDNNNNNKHRLGPPLRYPKGRPSHRQTFARLQNTRLAFSPNFSVDFQTQTSNGRTFASSDDKRCWRSLNRRVAAGSRPGRRRGAGPRLRRWSPWTFWLLLIIIDSCWLLLITVDSCWLFLAGPCPRLRRWSPWRRSRRYCWPGSCPGGRCLVKQ